jgi:hypothetical protein
MKEGRKPMLPVAFNPNWRAAGELAESVVRVHREVLRLEATHAPRARQRRPADAAAFALAVERLVCNVAAVGLAAPGRALATPRDRQRNAQGVAAATVLDTMAEGGLLAHRVGGWSADAGRHLLSDSRPTLALLDYLPHSLNAAHLRRAQDAVLELRSRKGALGIARTLPVPESPETRRLAAEMAALNEWLEWADVRRVDGCAAWLHEPDGLLPRVAHVQARQLRRIFSNGTLSQGGRAFGGWWQDMSQADRARLIRIDGEHIAELDFTAMVPRVCYALRGVPWPFGDAPAAPYMVGPQASRGAWKVLTNAFLASRRLLGAWVGKTSVQRREFAAQFGGLTWAQARAAVFQHHAGLADAGGFGCELGMEAMRMESDIAVDVVLRLRDQGIPCLPIHDGFAVAERNANAAREAMRAAGEAKLGVPLAVAAK